MDKEKIYIVDASGYLYRSYFAIRNMTNSRGESTNALFGFVRSVMRLIKDFMPQNFVVVFDGPDSKKSRTDLYADYKANREKMPDDLRSQIDLAQEFCEVANIPYLVIEGVEADDVMGSVACRAVEGGMQAFLCTSDKDFAQLVKENVFLLNTHKDNLIIDSAKVEELYEVAPEQIIDWLAIAGDTSDNIPGLSGFGPKTASKLLKEFGSLENILQNPEKVSGQKKQTTIREEADIARMSKVLATIDTNVNFDKNLDSFAYKESDQERLKEFYLKVDFLSLIDEVKKVDQSSVEYILVNDAASLKALSKDLAKAKEICFDTETTSSHPLKAELVGIGFCIKEGVAWYVPANGNLELGKILSVLHPIFADPQKGFFGHNVKYDVHVLRKYGVKVANICFDTILASYLLESHTHQHSLDYLAKHHFGIAKIPIKELIGTGKKAITMDQVPIDQVCTYCCEDADYTFRLKQIFQKDLEDRKLTSILFDIELPLLPILAEMERKGIYVDVDYLNSITPYFLNRIKELESKIHDLAGEVFSVNSPKQISNILFNKMGIKPIKKTATGYSTNSEVLSTLAGQYPIAEHVLKYRRLEKLRSTYIEALPKEVFPSTKRIHCTFNQSVAATGRLSSKDPNLQNIPIRTAEGRQIREAFRPQKEGWSFLAADYSQIELRVLAHLSEDPKLTEAFLQGEDIHTYTASLICNTPSCEVTKEMRVLAKTVNFGIVYGQQAFGLAKELKISISEASDFIKAYFERYPKVHSFLEECREQARKTGKAVTMMGRERLIPEINSPNKMISGAAERLAINTPVQGSAADLIKLAMIKVDSLLCERKMSSAMILQIHDELMFEMLDEEQEQLIEIVKKAMETVVPLRVPLVVNINVGKNWNEC